MGKGSAPGRRRRTTSSAHHSTSPSSSAESQQQREISVNASSATPTKQASAKNRAALRRRKGPTKGNHNASLHQKEVHENGANAINAGVQLLDRFISSLKNKISTNSNNASDAKKSLPSTSTSKNLDVSENEGITERDFESSDVLSVMSEVIDERSRPSLEYALGVLGANKVPEGLEDRHRKLGSKAFTAASRNRAIRRKREEKREETIERRKLRSSASTRRKERKEAKKAVAVTLVREEQESEVAEETEKAKISNKSMETHEEIEEIDDMEELAQPIPAEDLVKSSAMDVDLPIEILPAVPTTGKQHQDESEIRPETTRRKSARHAARREIIINADQISRPIEKNTMDQIVHATRKKVRELSFDDSTAAVLSAEATKIPDAISKKDQKSNADSVVVDDSAKMETLNSKQSPRDPLKVVGETTDRDVSTSKLSSQKDPLAVPAVVPGDGKIQPLKEEIGKSKSVESVLSPTGISSDMNLKTLPSCTGHVEKKDAIQKNPIPGRIKALTAQDVSSVNENTTTATNTTPITETTSKGTPVVTYANDIVSKTPLVSANSVRKKCHMNKESVMDNDQIGTKAQKRDVNSDFPIAETVPKLGSTTERKSETIPDHSSNLIEKTTVPSSSNVPYASSSKAVVGNFDPNAAKDADVVMGDAPLGASTPISPDQKSKNMQAENQAENQFKPVAGSKEGVRQRRRTTSRFSSVERLVTSAKNSVIPKLATPEESFKAPDSATQPSRKNPTFQKETPSITTPGKVVSGVGPDIEMNEKRKRNELTEGNTKCSKKLEPAPSSIENEVSSVLEDKKSTDDASKSITQSNLEPVKPIDVKRVENTSVGGKLQGIGKQTSKEHAGNVTGVEPSSEQGVGHASKFSKMSGLSNDSKMAFFTPCSVPCFQPIPPTPSPPPISIGSTSSSRPASSPKRKPKSSNTPRLGTQNQNSIKPSKPAASLSPQSNNLVKSSPVQTPVTRFGPAPPPNYSEVQIASQQRQDEKKTKPSIVLLGSKKGVVVSSSSSSRPSPTDRENNTIAKIAHDNSFSKPTPVMSEAVAASISPITKSPGRGVVSVAQSTKLQTKRVVTPVVPPVTSTLKTLRGSDIRKSLVDRAKGETQKPSNNKSKTASIDGKTAGTPMSKLTVRSEQRPSAPVDSIGPKNVSTLKSSNHAQTSSRQEDMPSDGVDNKASRPEVERTGSRVSGENSVKTVGEKLGVGSSTLAKPTTSKEHSTPILQKKPKSITPSGLDKTVVERKKNVTVVKRPVQNTSTITKVSSGTPIQQKPNPPSKDVTRTGLGSKIKQQGFSRVSTTGNTLAISSSASKESVATSVRSSLPKHTKSLPEKGGEKKVVSKVLVSRKSGSGEATKTTNVKYVVRKKGDVKQDGVKTGGVRIVSKSDGSSMKGSGASSSGVIVRKKIPIAKGSGISKTSTAGGKVTVTKLMKKPKLETTVNATAKTKTFTTHSKQNVRKPGSILSKDGSSSIVRKTVATKVVSKPSSDRKNIVVKGTPIKTAEKTAKASIQDVNRIQIKKVTASPKVISDKVVLVQSKEKVALAKLKAGVEAVVNLRTATSGKQTVKPITVPHNVGPKVVPALHGLDVLGHAASAVKRQDDTVSFSKKLPRLSVDLKEQLKTSAVDNKTVKINGDVVDGIATGRQNSASAVTATVVSAVGKSKSSIGKHNMHGTHDKFGSSFTPTSSSKEENVTASTDKDVVKTGLSETNQETKIIRTTAKIPIELAELTQVGKMIDNVVKKTPVKVMEIDNNKRDIAADVLSNVARNSEIAKASDVEILGNIAEKQDQDIVMTLATTAMSVEINATNRLDKPADTIGSRVIQKPNEQVAVGFPEDSVNKVEKDHAGRKGETNKMDPIIFQPVLDNRPGEIAAVNQEEIGTSRKEIDRTKTDVVTHSDDKEEAKHVSSNVKSNRTGDGGDAETMEGRTNDLSSKKNLSGKGGPKDSLPDKTAVQTLAQSVPGSEAIHSCKEKKKLNNSPHPTKAIVKLPEKDKYHNKKDKAVHEVKKQVIEKNNSKRKADEIQPLKLSRTEKDEVGQKKTIEIKNYPKDSEIPVKSDNKKQEEKAEKQKDVAGQKEMEKQNLEKKKRDNERALKLQRRFAEEKVEESGRQKEKDWSVKKKKENERTDKDEEEQQVKENKIEGKELELKRHRESEKQEKDKAEINEKEKAQKRKKTNQEAAPKEQKVKKTKVEQQLELEDIFGDDGTSSRSDSELNPIGQAASIDRYGEGSATRYSTADSGVIKEESEEEILEEVKQVKVKIGKSKEKTEEQKAGQSKRRSCLRGLTAEAPGTSGPDTGERLGSGQRRLRRESTNLRDAWAVPGDLVFSDALMQECVKVWSNVNQARISIPFRDPVMAKDAPNYFDIVKRPMDLSTVRGDLENKKIDNPRKFYDDMMLICRNALLYNDVESDIYSLAIELNQMIRKSAKPIVRKWLASRKGGRSSKEGVSSDSSLSSSSSEDETQQTQEQQLRRSGQQVRVDVGQSESEGEDRQGGDDVDNGDEAEEPRTGRGGHSRRGRGGGRKRRISTTGGAAGGGRRGRGKKRRTMGETRADEEDARERDEIEVQGIDNDERGSGGGGRGRQRGRGRGGRRGGRRMSAAPVTVITSSGTGVDGEGSSVKKGKRQRSASGTFAPAALGDSEEREGEGPSRKRRRISNRRFRGGDDA